MFYKIYGWFCLVIGVLAFFSGVNENDTATLAGGIMFGVAGLCILQLIEKK